MTSPFEGSPGCSGSPHTRVQQVKGGATLRNCTHVALCTPSLKEGDHMRKLLHF